MDINDFMYDRLLLTEQRIKAMSNSCYELIKILDPLSKFDNEKSLITGD
jgi:gamma-glutamyl phosphate reductase